MKNNNSIILSIILAVVVIAAMLAFFANQINRNRVQSPLGQLPLLPEGAAATPRQSSVRVLGNEYQCVLVGKNEFPKFSPVHFDGYENFLQKEFGYTEVDYGTEEDASFQSFFKALNVLPSKTAVRTFRSELDAWLAQNPLTYHWEVGLGALRCDTTDAFHVKTLIV